MEERKGIIPKNINKEIDELILESKSEKYGKAFVYFLAREAFGEYSGAPADCCCPQSYKAGKQEVYFSLLRHLGMDLADPKKHWN